MGLQQKLVDFLKTENPTIRKRGRRERGLTQSKAEEYYQLEWVTSWEDFDHESLQSIYGGDLQEILHSSHDFGERLSVEPYILTITNEDSVNALIHVWTQRYVNQALSKAQACLEDNATRQNVHMVLGGQANYPGSDSRCNPDWAAVKVRGSDFLQLVHTCSDIQDRKAKANDRKRLPNIILPGDSKPSKKWSSKQIVHGPVELEFSESKEWYYPLCQVFTYCVKAKVRYGFIITDEELVVLRVRPFTGWRKDSLPEEDRQSIRLPVSDREEKLYTETQTLDSQRSDQTRDSQRSDQTRDSQRSDQTLDSQRSDKKRLPDPSLSATERTRKFGVVEFKAIPWTAKNGYSNALTVNLALWWLCILAGQNNEIQDHYPKLSDETWTERISDMRSDSEKSQLVKLSETPDGGCQEAEVQGLHTPNRQARADSEMSKVDQGISRTKLGPAANYPTPESIEHNNKRSRDAEDDDGEEGPCTRSRKRRNVPLFQL